MVSILTFVRVAQRTQRLLFKMETKFLTKHYAELFQYCRIVRSSLTFPNTYFTDREYFESWCIHRKSGCEVGQMDLLDGSLRHCPFVHGAPGQADARFDTVSPRPASWVRAHQYFACSGLQTGLGGKRHGARMAWSTWSPEHESRT